MIAAAARRLIPAAVVAAVLVAAAPVALVAVGAAVTAWLYGWPPRRLYGAALWCLPAVAVWLGASAAGGQLDAPYHAWLSMWALARAGHLAAAAVTVAPVAVPSGLALGGLAWAYRTHRMETGAGGRSPGSVIGFDRRQWRRQVRSARARIAAPGAVPLTRRNGDVAIGGTIRAVGHPVRPVAALPYARLRSHQVVIGTTGTGKTTLLLRLWAGFMATALARQAAGHGRQPLLVVLDCKGGRDARRKADRTRRLLYAAGARRVAIWPDEARLSMWDLPPQDLAVLLYQMIESGTGAAAYYADMLYACVVLAVTAPAGPPFNTASFLDRLDTKWLQHAWGDGRPPRQFEQARAAAKHLRDIQLRYATLLDRLGPALDGPGRLDEADAGYFILEGTREPSVAEAQAMAITELAARAATALEGEQRAMLLAADDYSAVSRRVPMSNLYERGRSLGIGVQVSAQSWQGLGADEDERYRIATTADGGIFVLHTPHPDPLVALAGKRRVLETAHKLVGNTWGDEGTTREQRAWVADPDLIRRLEVGQACYIHHGAATFVQVARPAASPLTLLPPPAPEPPPAPAPEPRQEPTPPSWPPAGGLDDIFGPGDSR